MPHSTRPLVGITADLGPHPRTARPQARVALAYAQAIERAGATPIILPPIPSLAERFAETCDAFVLTGGDDPRTEPFGKPTHPRTTPIEHDRQEFEIRLLRALDDHPETPLLGVCLGMQLMGLLAGGELDQHLPDTLPTHADHLSHDHEIIPEHTPSLASELPELMGTVHSHHRQALRSPGTLVVIARAHDGVIEAVIDPKKRFSLGVQWHPERTTDPTLGDGLFLALVRAIL
ncbi:MAG: gamma-glutamyl-gamma-aminobutyrate hydrolase family protein [Phycisphaerales bacterium]|nr:MAG: gamma-glutamyl-gamma-aminobutyrate hydrolase family protein [Phycisphaerales bacterium]